MLRIQNEADTIGILALMVAIAVVFQGALPAGSGRFKASGRAIGPVCREETVRKFNSLELRYRNIG